MNNKKRKTPYFDDVFTAFCLKSHTMGSRHPHRPMASSLIVLLLLSSFLPPLLADLNSDRSALIALRFAVGPSVLPTWNPSTSPCGSSWQGVTCESNRVSVLRLPGAGLIGRIPTGSIGNLTALRTLSLRFNALSGPLPSDLSSASQLRNLYLHGNRFSGPVPQEIFSLSKLVRLNLAQNSFSGDLSPRFNNLTRLATLYLENNRFTGEIPDLYLPALAQFNVSFNALNGSIPSNLHAMPSTSFLGMPLCGSPLPACPGEIAPSPSAVSRWRW